MAHRKTLDPQVRVSAVALGAVLGISHQRVCQLAARGTLEVGEDHLYQLDRNVQRYLAHRAGRALPRGGEDDDTGDEGVRRRSLIEEQTRVAAAKADLAELDVARRRGELVELEQYEQAASEVVRFCATALLALPASIGPDGAGKTSEELEAVCRRHIHRALRGFDVSKILSLAGDGERDDERTPDPFDDLASS